MPARLIDYYKALRKKFGPQKWWPAETTFEMMVGAILTQNVAWANVERAIVNLKSMGLLSPEAIDACDAGTLAMAIKPAGFFRVKSKRLKNYVAWFVRAGDLSTRSTSALREELLEIKGVGPETADSILLYGLGRPSFVIDQYTYRVLTRHHFISEETTYDEMKELFESQLPKDVPLYNDFHAQIVRVGKEYCRTKPLCETCPLKRYLP